MAALMTLVMCLSIFHHKHTRGPPSAIHHSFVSDSEEYFQGLDLSELESKQPDVTLGKRALVTAGRTSLTVSVIDELLKSGWHVTLVSSKNLSAICQHFSEALTGDLLQIETTDVTDIASLRRVIQSELRAVLHLDTWRSSWALDNFKMYYHNVIGSRVVARVCLEKGIGRLVFASSVDVYQYSTKCHGDGNLLIDESAPQVGMGSWLGHVHAMYLSERQMESARNRGLSVTCINLPEPLGKFDNDGIEGLIRRARRHGLWAVGRGGRTYANVEDLARALVSAASIPNPAPSYLLDGVYMTNEELVQQVLKMAHASRTPTLPGPFLRVAGLLVNLVSETLLETGYEREIYRYGIDKLLTMEQALVETCETARIDSSLARRDLQYPHHVLVGPALQEVTQWLDSTANT